MRRTGLFTDVRAVKASADAVGVDWVVRQELERRPLHEPMLTVLTVGIVPEFAFDDVEYVWVAQRLTGPRTVCRAGWSASESSIMGWIGLPLALLPSWALQSSDAAAQASADRLGIELIRAGVAAPSR